jgi:hypothetical protein
MLKDPYVIEMIARPEFAHFDGDPIKLLNLMEIHDKIVSGELVKVNNPDGSAYLYAGKV